MAEASGEESTLRVDEDQKDIILYDIQLATLQRTAVSGVQSFPFSVVLPPGLPPSMEVHIVHKVQNVHDEVHKVHIYDMI